MIRLSVACAWTVVVLVLTLGPTAAGIILACLGFGVVVWGYIDYTSRHAMRRERELVWARRETL